MKKFYVLFVTVFLTVLFTGCLTLPEQDMQAKLDPRIGVMKADEALSTWGTPTSTIQGDEIFIYEWNASKTGSYYNSYTGQYDSYPLTEILRLTFDKKTKLLTAYTYINR